MLTHVDDKNQPTMVNVGEKKKSQRVAIARSKVFLPECVFQHMVGDEIQSKKGPVFATAIIAGTMAVKKTSDLIPFCHPLPIDGCNFDMVFDEDNYVSIECRVEVFHKTGVEMEALVGASTAALTIYDMCKAMSHDIKILETRLVEKTGGKSDFKGS